MSKRYVTSGTEGRIGKCCKKKNFLIVKKIEKSLF